MAELIIQYGDSRHKKGSIKLNRLAQMLPGGLIKAFNKVGAILSGQIAKNLSGQSHTRFPGNSNPFPGVLTETLRASTQWELLKPYGVAVGVGGLAKKYSAVHEFGSKSQNIPPRPYVKPAWEEKEKEVMDIIYEAIERPLK